MEGVGWRIHLTKGEAIQVRIGNKWRNGRCLSLHEDEDDARIMVGYRLDTDQTSRIHFMDMATGDVRKWGEGEDNRRSHEGEEVGIPPALGASSNSWLKRQRRKQKEIKEWQEKSKELSGKNSGPRSPKTR